MEPSELKWPKPLASSIQSSSAAVEQIWHIGDTKGKILALT